MSIDRVSKDREIWEFVEEIQDGRNVKARAIGTHMLQ